MEMSCVVSNFFVSYFPDAVDEVVHLPQEVHLVPLVRLAPRRVLGALEERLVAVGKHALQGLQRVGAHLPKEQILYVGGMRLCNRKKTVDACVHQSRQDVPPRPPWSRRAAAPAGRCAKRSSTSPAAARRRSRPGVFVKIGLIIGRLHPFIDAYPIASPHSPPRTSVKNSSGVGAAASPPALPPAFGPGSIPPAAVGAVGWPPAASAAVDPAERSWK